MDKKVMGLSSKQVEQLKQEGLVNYDTDVKTKSVGQIITTNFFTLFNFLNIALACAIFFVGSYKNLLFLGVVICNTLISTVQEIRSKMIVDKLSLLNEEKVNVIRDGQRKSIGINEIVLGEICVLKLGNQIVTDSKIVHGEILVNEALITGESQPVSKKVGDNLLSGSFVIAGSCITETIHIGQDNYTAKTTAQAKYIKEINSDIMNFINKIIKIVSITIIPVGILLFIHQLYLPNNTFQHAVVSVVAALIGMIPEGLVLLTSTVLAIGTMRLSKYKVLVQEIYCIETLARVDVLCLDKTGTLTEGSMNVNNLISLDDNASDVLNVISHYMANDNQTMEAICKKFKREDRPVDRVKKIIPFNSQNKWSALVYGDFTYILGAPEIILSDTRKYQDILDRYTENNRVILLAKSKETIEKKFFSNVSVMAFIIISDRIKPDAKATLEYFKDQGVNIKLISGDSPKTVAGVAKKVGLEDINYVDMSRSKIPIKDLVKKYNVFGRVKPDQKKQIIYEFKRQGHTVAMIGDGVNDVLALKEADCSIAMNSGSDAARNVSQLVLLNSNFSSMPKVVAEGRRCINNLQRSSSLFLCKTTYAVLLALIFLFLNRKYPFMPIQLTLTSMVTIGIPSFILALEPNYERLNGNIIVNVLNKSLPTALTIATNVIIITMLNSIIRINYEEISTLAVMLTGATGFMLLYRISVPFNSLRRVLFVSLIILFVSAILLFRNLFSLTYLNIHLLILAGVLFIIALAMFNVYLRICNNITKKIKWK